MQEPLTDEPNFDKIDISQLGSKEKLSFLRALLSTLNSPGTDLQSLYANTLYNIDKLIYIHSHESSSRAFSLKDRARLVNESLENSDRDVAEHYEFSHALLNRWRNEEIAILYFLFQYNLKSKFNSNLKIDETIEKSPTFKKLLKIYKETSFLIAIKQNVVVNEMIIRIPYMYHMIMSFIKYNSIEKFAIETKILNRNDKDLYLEVANLNQSFRMFFFEGESNGFNKFFRRVLWMKFFNDSNSQWTAKHRIANIYKIRTTEVERRSVNKLNLVKGVIEWIIRNEYSLDKSAGMDKTILFLKYGAVVKNMIVDYEIYIDYMQTSAGNFPDFLMQILKAITKDPGYIKTVIKNIDSGGSYKDRNQGFTSLLSTLENGFLDADITTTSKASAIRHLNNPQSYLLNSLKQAVIEYRDLVDNQSISIESELSEEEEREEHESFELVVES